MTGKLSCECNMEMSAIKATFIKRYSKVVSQAPWKLLEEL